MSWHEPYFTKKWLDWYRREVDLKYGGVLDDPDDVCAEAVKIIYERLAQYEPAHRDHLDALVKTAFRRALVDATRRHPDGRRVRVPPEMERVGPPVPNIFFAFCLQRKPAYVIAEELHLSLLSVEEWTVWLQANDRCPSRKTESISGGDPDDPTVDRDFAFDDRKDPVGDDVEREQMKAMATWIFDPDAPIGGKDEPLSDELVGKLRAIRQVLALTPEESLMLRLHFLEELKPAEIGEEIVMKVHTVRRRLKDVIRRIGDVFRDHGLTR